MLPRERPLISCCKNVDISYSSLISELLTKGRKKFTCGLRLLLDYITLD